jgi:hypothetical protein
MRCDRAVLAAAVLLCGASAADELVFTSGAVLTGKVHLGGAQVRAVTEHGALVVSQGSVASVTVGGVTTVLGAVVERDVAVVAGRGRRPERRQLSALAEAAVVSLRLKDVRASQVLDLSLEQVALGWKLKGNVVQFLPQEEVGRFELRGYAVRDLLVNTHDADAAASRTPMLAQAGGGYGGAYGGSFSRSGRGRDGYGSNRGYDGFGGLGGGYQSSQDRAFGLATLITEVIRPDSWDDPAVMTAGAGGGGAGRRDDGDEWRGLEARGQQ